MSGGLKSFPVKSVRGIAELWTDKQTNKQANIDKDVIAKYKCCKNFKF